MIHTIRARRGAVVASHHLAAQAGLSVLRDGGNAIEAMVAAATTISVVYPHMNGLGGDGFWLIDDGAGEPIAIMGIGAAGRSASVDFYRGAGLDRIPDRGPLAANTVAGTVSSWQAALEIAHRWGGRLPIARLLEDATHYAGEGFPVTRSQFEDTAAKRDELADTFGFAETFLADGAPPPVGATFRNEALANTLARLSAAGLDDFYRGDLARVIAADLESAGAPVGLADLEDHSAVVTAPLAATVGDAAVFNTPPPTQGLASLLILGLFERIAPITPDGFDYVHRLVEATKRAFRIRNADITDLAFMFRDPAEFLEPSVLDALAGEVDPARALPWPEPAGAGDTVWLGAVDGEGRAVSFIHSIYWEFGSGVVLRDSGITWQNRGTSFALDPGLPNPLQPGRRPFHTNNPAMARLPDGRRMVYGTMGGDGQPQTQAAVFTRYARYGLGLQEAVTAARWLLGRRWGEERTNLSIESRIGEATIEALIAAGHDVEVRGPFDALFGHAGALVRHRDGTIEGAADPRGDGVVAAY